VNRIFDEIKEWNETRFNRKHEIMKFMKGRKFDLSSVSCFHVYRVKNDNFNRA